jgi:hypothetical protein
VDKLRHCLAVARGALLLAIQLRVSFCVGGARAGKDVFKFGETVTPFKKDDELASAARAGFGGEVVIVFYAKVGTEGAQLVVVVAGKDLLAQGGQVFGCVGLWVHRGLPIADLLQWQSRPA